MREIIFRGKDIFTGEWVEGYYSKVSFGNGFGDAIVKFDGGSTRPYEVDLETIGQFTGLLDKNGARIFEGDIVTNTTKRNRFKQQNGTSYYITAYDETASTVVFDEHWCCFSFTDRTERGQLRVIDNVHDQKS